MPRARSSDTTLKPSRPGSITSRTMQPNAPPSARLDPATFGGGCFWSMERAFDQVDGVVSVTVGYTGGRVPHPSYEQVSTGQTGHLESVQVVYDARKLEYERLVDAFWHNIDPTQADGQFCDHGPEYHTAIFYRDSTQHRVAAASRRALEQRFKQPIATEIVRAGVFYPAEQYHQHYYRKNPFRYALYRTGCGRDRRLRGGWGADAPHAGGEAALHDTKPNGARPRAGVCPPADPGDADPRARAGGTALLHHLGRAALHSGRAAASGRLRALPAVVRDRAALIRSARRFRALARPHAGPYVRSL